MSVIISNGILTASVNPKGAELVSLKTSEKEYMWEGNPEFWGKHSPVLFPIVGTLKNNTYTINNTEYVLPRHGFARDNVFTIKQQDKDKVIFSLTANPDTLKVYPFDFELEMIYSLIGKKLYLNYVIINKSSFKMPFCIGAHPAFALPGNFEDYSIVFEKNEPLVSVQLVNDLLSDISTELPAVDGKLPLQQNLFANDALIFTNLQSRNVTITKNDQNYLKVSFPKFPHLGVWTKPGAPFLCIEPWQGYSDNNNTKGDFYTKAGAVTLAAGEKYDVGFEIEIF